MERAYQMSPLVKYVAGTLIAVALGLGFSALDARRIEARPSLEQLLPDNEPVRFEDLVQKSYIPTRTYLQLKKFG